MEFNGELRRARYGSKSKNGNEMPHKNVDVVHRLIDDERKFASIQFFFGGEGRAKTANKKYGARVSVRVHFLCQKLLVYVV